jgi:signal transduction histidine kinase
MAPRRRRLPGIRTLLLATYLVVLLLPVAGFGMLRLYESSLIRQTEAELLAQAAALSAAYRAAWLERAPHGALAAMPWAELTWDVPTYHGSPERWLALLPQLDLAESPILPPPPDPVPADRAPDPVALEIAPSLGAIARDVRRMTLAGIRIVDGWGVIVVSSAISDLGRTLAAQEEVKHALRGGPTANLRKRIVGPADYSLESLSRNTDLRVFVAVPILTEGRVLGAVLVSRTPRNIVQTLYSKRYALLGLAALLVAAVVALAWFAGYTVVRPTRQLAAMARRVAARETSTVEPLASPMTREAQSLSASIVTMARTLEARADDVRELALGISHELKTPLTGIRGSAELLRDHLEEMSAEERARFLSNIVADTERLERLVRRILELARADALVPEGDEVCDVARAARDAAGSRRHVLVEGLPVSLTAAIDCASFEIILSTLLDNAFHHGGANVTARLSGHIEGREAIVEVTDDGVGISPANAERIFDRFFTTARDSGGTGLGLAIAKRRAAAFGGDVTFVPIGRGATFRVKLRAAW